MDLRIDMQIDGIAGNIGDGKLTFLDGPFEMLTISGFTVLADVGPALTSPGFERTGHGPFVRLPGRASAGQYHDLLASTRPAVLTWLREQMAYAFQMLQPDGQGAGGSSTLIEVAPVMRNSALLGQLHIDVKPTEIG